MKVTLTLLPHQHSEEAFDFEDFKRWTASKKKQWLADHPDSKFAKLLGLRKQNMEREPQKPVQTRPEPKPEVKTKQELLKEKLAKHLEQEKLKPHLEHRAKLGQLHRSNEKAKALRAKLKDYAWGGNSKKVTPKIARFIERRTNKVLGRLEHQNQWVHAQLLRHMAKTLRKAGIDPRELPRGSMRAGSIAYVGRDPRVAKVWDEAKAQLKESREYRQWAQANQHIKSLRKTSERYAQLANRGHDNVDHD